VSALWSLSFPAWHFVLRAAVVYAALLLLLRLAGKRQVGQMGAHDFVALLLISNAVQNSMNGGDNSITGGLILAAAIIVMSAFLNWATFKSKRLEAMIEGRPRLLIHRGKLLLPNLEKELVNAHELRIRLRRQGVQRFEDVEQAVLESDGALSIIRKDEISSPHAA
jgi:uncharacterized membrane protein YcaP (DUF421 family)